MFFNLILLLQKECKKGEWLWNLSYRWSNRSCTLGQLISSHGVLIPSVH